MSTFDPADCSVVYTLFNDGWNLVARNKRHQSGGALGPEDKTHELPRYLDYLAHSLISLHATTAPAGEICVRLVEISPEGIAPAKVARFLASRVPQIAPQVRIEVVPLDRTLPFIEEMLALPPTLYRSPNRLHEFLMLDAIKTARLPYVAIVDSDVLFMARDALWLVGAALAKAPGKSIAAFLERSLDKPRPEGTLRTRERMHSVLLLADARAFARFSFEPFLRRSSLEERVAVLADTSVRDYYLGCRVLDTLSLVTDWLREGGADRILDLSTLMPRYREAGKLTIVSEWMIHAKYLDPSAFPAVREAIAAEGAWADQPVLRFVADRVGKK
jgi:hypothetical protein